MSGTPLAAASATGNLLWSESYRPYGDPMQVPLDAGNKQWFMGKPCNGDTGMT